MGLILHESVGISWEMCSVMAIAVQPRAKSLYRALWKRGAQAPGAAWQDRDRCFVGSSVDKDVPKTADFTWLSSCKTAYSNYSYSQNICVYLLFSLLVPLAGVQPCKALASG